MPSFYPGPYSPAVLAYALVWGIPLFGAGLTVMLREDQDFQGRAVALWCLGAVMLVILYVGIGVIGPAFLWIAGAVIALLGTELMTGGGQPFYPLLLFLSCFLGGWLGSHWMVWYAVQEMLFGILFLWGIGRRRKHILALHWVGSFCFLMAMKESIQSVGSFDMELVRSPLISVMAPLWFGAGCLCHAPLWSLLWPTCLKAGSSLGRIAMFLGYWISFFRVWPHFSIDALWQAYPQLMGGVRAIALGMMIYGLRGPSGLLWLMNGSCVWKLTDPYNLAPFFVHMVGLLMTIRLASPYQNAWWIWGIRGMLVIAALKTGGLIGNHWLSLGYVVWAVQHRPTGMTELSLGQKIFYAIFYTGWACWLWYTPWF